MATDLNENVLNSAALATRALRTLPGPHDAQISLSLASAYLCSQYNIAPELFCRVLQSNIEQTASDASLMNRVVERIHNVSTDPDLIKVFQTLP